MQNRFYFKIGFIFSLMVLLMIPRMFLDGLVSEREHWRSTAVNSIAQGWPGAQVLGGPIISVPYTLSWTVREKITEDGERVVTREETVKRTAHLLPTNLIIQGNLDASTRSRGIYEVPVYTSTLQAGGDFSTQPLLDIIAANPDKRVTWATPVLCVLVQDQRGISRQVTLRWNGQELPFKPGSLMPEADAGMHAKLPDFDLSETATLPFSFDLELNGMESISYALLAENTDIRLGANWPHPSFSGDLLPETREISESGFNAQWKTSVYSSNVAGAMASLDKGDTRGLLWRAVGVRLIQPVDVYQMSERSIKYAVLFLLLTFGSMLLFELLKKAPVHPVQYTLVGFALLIFYLLLVSLSERIPFGAAYGLAAGLCTALLGAYFGAILRNRRLGLLLGSCLALLYGTLYVILQAEDNALIMGSLLLFGVLTALMLGTRHFDWYALTAGKTGEGGPSATTQDRQITDAR